MDTISPKHRSWNMSRIRGENTKPEVAVRSLLHRMGYRFRLHVKALPGTPDIVLPRFRVAVFVHGCFWHRHRGCKFAYTPRSRVAFWKNKFSENVERDARKEKILRQAGWIVAVVWECELRNADKLASRLRRMLRN